MYQWFFLCLTVLSSYGASDEQLFIDATAAYQAGAYEQALQQFTAIAHPSSTVWYNAGNAAYQNRAYAQAVLYWLRAAEAAGGRLYRDAWHNVQYVYAVVGNSFSSVDLMHYLCRYVASYVPLLYAQIVIILAWIIILMMQRRKLLHRSLLLCISLLSILVLLMTWACSPSNDRAVVVAHDAHMYAGRSTHLYQLATLPPGQLVRVESTHDAWCKILYQGQVGWVACEHLALIAT